MTYLELKNAYTKARESYSKNKRNKQTFQELLILEDDFINACLNTIPKCVTKQLDKDIHVYGSEARERFINGFLK